MGKTHDQLDIDERYEIYRLHEAGVCLREIGRMMGHSASTISRELRDRPIAVAHSSTRPNPSPQGGYVTDSSGQWGFLRRGGERFWR